MHHILQDFVPLHARPGFGALATRADDASVRVIVGKMGAGKTVYMRRLHSFQEQSPSVYADRPQQKLPQTDLIVRVCHWFKKEYQTEKWMQLWGRAIMRSLATHVLTSKELRSSVPEELADELRSVYGHLLGDFRRPRSIYSQLGEIINEHNTAHHLARFLDNPAWEDLEDLLGEVLRSSRPVFFYLDAVDDTFNSAPLYWLRCHEGLFLQVMQLLRDSKFGARLHVVICVRDVVLSSVYRSEHAPRYHNEPHIRLLTWTRDAIEFLLQSKLERLAPEYQMAPGLTDPMSAWLGTTWIHNERRGVDENLLDYVVRHTRLIPRDIVAVGNDLSRAVLQQKEMGRSEIPPELLRRIVGSAAKRFGDSQLAQCASQIAADMVPADAAQKGYLDAFLSNQEYAASLRDELKEVVKAVGIDRFGRDGLAQLQELGQVAFEGNSHVAAVLWQNGLLGYVDEGESRFYSLSDAGDLELPRDAEGYVFHPCMLDAVHGLRSVGSTPVTPYIRD